MYDIEMQEMTPAFLECWRSAGIHLNRRVDGGIRFWLRAHPYPPFLEHLSFRLGNQIFLVRVEDVENAIRGPGSIDGLLYSGKQLKGWPCILPMKRQASDRQWVAAHPGWGLFDARDGTPLDPITHVTEQRIEMTPWEIQDFAVQIVRDELERNGFRLMSWQGNPDVDPSIWFIGETGKPEWVVVRPAIYPETKAEVPPAWAAIADGCSRQSTVGHFASVAIAPADDDESAEPGSLSRLWRGHALEVNFAGLEPKPLHPGSLNI